MVNYIVRDAENSIKKLEKMFKVILVTGPRQAGKSTMLKHIKKSITYVTFDNMIIRKLLRDDPMSFFETYKLPIIIDEIQKEKDTFSLIKYEVDKTDKKGQVYISGSQSFALMKFVSESLAGRVGIINLLPLSLREIYKIENYKSFLPTKKYISRLEKIKDSVKKIDIWKHILYGGMPALYSEKNMNLQNYFSSYVTTYLEKDIRELAQVGDLTKFYNFMVALASMSANILNIESIANDMKINRKTCEHYLSILESSHIIYLLKPYYNNQLKRLIKSPKVYFLDTGILAYLLGWKDKRNIELGPMAGIFFETFVISEIIKSYYNSGIVHLPIYYYRDKEKREIDLIIEENGTLYPIEIKKHKTIDKNDVSSFSVLKKIKNIKIGEGALISTYDEIIKIDENVYNIPVWGI